ncbi:hypothetical protein BN940_02081 [Castellaniella defragrans 65Phen]|uniref:Uncharacterized protein n=1 Tax=Castellaniella defragrans (strain DSM 12143 / CCUG 39792 / 65Phen) TaxID=1437824 RepID=W8X0T1_CASD6|nr:hypothetical protein BN940_02081 [Castellaniella defragrans 65Phen]
MPVPCSKRGISPRRGLHAAPIRQAPGSPQGLRGVQTHPGHPNRTGH